MSTKAKLNSETIKVMVVAMAKDADGNPRYLEQIIQTEEKDRQDLLRLLDPEAYTSVRTKFVELRENTGHGNPDGEERANASLGKLHSAFIEAFTAFEQGDGEWDPTKNCPSEEILYAYLGAENAEPVVPLADVEPTDA